MKLSELFSGTGSVGRVSLFDGWLMCDGLASLDAVVFEAERLVDIVPLLGGVSQSTHGNFHLGTHGEVQRTDLPTGVDADHDAGALDETTRDIDVEEFLGECLQVKLPFVLLEAI